MGKIQELYNTLKSAGADVGTEKEFADWFQAPGQDGYNNRKHLYDTFKSAGADVGDSYEEFASWLNLQPKATQTVDNASKAAPTAKPTQTPKATQQPSMDVVTTTPKSRLEVSTEDDRPSQSYEKTTDPVLRSTTVINPEAAQEWEGYKETNPLQAQYIEKSIGADRKLPTFEQYVKADAEAQREDPIGYAFSKSMNEMSSADRAHAYLADQKAEIEKQLNDIAKKRMQDYADSNGAVLGMTVQEYLNLDEDYKNLSAALEQAKKSEKVSDNAREARAGDSGFLRGIADGLTDANAWTLGALDIQGLMPMMRLKRKLDNGEQLTETEQALAQQMATNTAISEEYSDKQGSWYNIGNIASQSLPFMLQFAMTGGGFGTLTRVGTKLGADAARKFTQNALLRNIIKYTGTAVGDIAGAAVMANTVGAANTVNDIFDRYRGTLIQTGDGQYQFAGGKGLGQSIYEGATAQTIEFYTEKLGAHLAITKQASKALGEMGLSKLSTAMSKLGGNKTLSVLGMQDYPSELLEEEANIILNASFVGDNQFKDLWDSKQQTDLALGMLFSVGGMQAGTTAVNGAYSGAQYQRMKHAMNKWQVRGSGVFNDNAEWARIQNSLDNADNQHIADAVNSILDNGKYTESQKRAIAGYASALVKMRGYNSALMSIVTDPKEPKRDNKLAEEMIGYNANPQQRRELYLEAYGSRKALSQFMDDEQIGEIVADPEAYLASDKADSFTAEQKAQIDGFAHNQIALNSTRQRIADDTDLEVANFEATVDRMSNDGNIVSGTIRNTGEDSKEKPRKDVVVIKGKVVTNDDGSVNVEQSDESLVALVDGKEQMIAPKDLADVKITSAEEQKNLERERISNEYVLSQESGMNGMPINKVGNTFKYLDPDGVEHTATIVPTADGRQLPDGQLFVSIDGAEPVAMSQTPLQVGINDYDYAQLQEEKRNKGKQKPTADTASTDQAATPTEDVEATTGNAVQPQPQYKQGDRVTVNYGGQQYEGTITGEYNDGEKLLVEFEGPDGTRTYPFATEDVSPIEAVAIPEQTDTATDTQIGAVEPTEEPTAEPTSEPTSEPTAEPTADETAPAKAIDRIPKDESGQPLYEQSDVATAAEAVLDETEGDADIASTVVNSMIEDKKKALDKANKAKSKGGNTISEKIASEKERKAAIDKAQSELDFWKGVADELPKRNGTTVENVVPQADAVEETPTADEAAADVAPTAEGTGVTTTTTATPTAATETATDTATDEATTTTDEADKAATDSQEPSSKQTNNNKDAENQAADGVRSKGIMSEGEKPEIDIKTLRKKWAYMRGKMPGNSVFVIEDTDGRLYSFDDDATRINAALNGKGEKANTDFIEITEQQFKDAAYVLGLKNFRVGLYNVNDINIDDTADTEAKSALDTVKDIIRAVAERRNVDTSNFGELLRGLTDDELNSTSRYADNAKGRSKADKENIGALRRAIAAELDERANAADTKAAEQKGYDGAIEFFKNAPNDFDYDNFINSHEQRVVTAEANGWPGEAAVQRGVVRAAIELKKKSEAANKDAEAQPKDEQSKAKPFNDANRSDEFNELVNLIIETDKLADAPNTTDAIDAQIERNSEKVERIMRGLNDDEFGALDELFYGENPLFGKDSIYDMTYDRIDEERKLAKAKAEEQAKERAIYDSEQSRLKHTYDQKEIDALSKAYVDAKKESRKAWRVLTDNKDEERKDELNSAYDSAVSKKSAAEKALESKLSEYDDKTLVEIGKRDGDISQITSDILRVRAANRALAHEYVNMLDNQGEISSKGKPKYRLIDFVDKKSARIPVRGIYHDNGYAIATNLYTLVADKRTYSEADNGKIIDSNGEVIAMEYPAWRKIMPKAIRATGIDAKELLDFLAGVKEKAKVAKEKYDGCIVMMNIGGTIWAAKAEQLEKFAQAALGLGGKIYLQDIVELASSPMHTESANGFAMVMPVPMSASDLRNNPKNVFVYKPTTLGVSEQSKVYKETHPNEVADDTSTEAPNENGNTVADAQSAETEAKKDTAKVEAQTEQKDNAVEKIEDVGEKIGGAKKDLAAEAKQRMADDLEKSDSQLASEIESKTLNKIFNFDLPKLRASGMSNEIISFIKICKQMIPAKPRVGYKVRQWVRDTMEVYKLCLNAGTKWEQLSEMLKGKYADSKLAMIYNSYMAVGGFDSGLELNGAYIRQLGADAKMYDNGKEVSLAGKWYVSGAAKHSGTYDTKEEAIEALKAYAGDNAVPKSSGKKQIEFVVYRNNTTGKFFITPKGKGDIILQDGFETSKEAFAYIKEHNAEMAERYQTLLSETKVDFNENRERKGRDYRGGKDISAQEFMDTFGFRGVEFGNWTNQKDRAKSINECYDALMDLADVLGVDPKALSLNGTLGMAFGARGGGKFSAHYEPDKVVINLTKTKGAGSLAHEWFHAVDNYFAKMGGAKLGFATSGEGLFPEGITMIPVIKGNYLYYDSKTRGRITEEEYKQRLANHGVRKEMVDAWLALMKAINASDYRKRSGTYAHLHSSNYWTEPTELGARAFSKWVENELSKRNAINDYLANNPAIFAEGANEYTRRYSPYPFDTDAQWMEESFGNLFSTMEQKTDSESGKVMLYHKADGTVSELTSKETALRNSIIDLLHNAGIDVITDNKEAQRVLDDEISRDGVRMQKVYHGSGADFDAFDFSHMGEGEGAQAYGWGGYVTEVEGIGRTYARSSSSTKTLNRSKLRHEISFLEESLPFWSGEAKLEGEERLKQLEEELYRLESEPEPVLYTVEIPDDNGENYITWSKGLPKSQRKKIADHLRTLPDSLLDTQRQVHGSNWLPNGWNTLANVIENNPTWGKDIVERLKDALGSSKEASMTLFDVGFVGISYPAQYRSGGRNDAAKNYVIFNESDMKITDKARFFRTKDGVAYGFTIGGKIYIDTSIAKADTPIHEYTHLWASALRESNPKEWANVVSLMKGTPIWDSIRQNYPELTADDEIADEVLAHYSGQRGAERLREAQRKAAEESVSVMASANAVSAIERVRKALSKFWKGVADLLNIHFTTAEEVADRVLYDLLRGYKPQGKAVSNVKLQKTESEEGDLLFRQREKPAPKKTIKVYKLMRLGADDKLYPLFIDSAAPIEMRQWYDGDAPDFEMLKKLPSGIHLLNAQTGEYVMDYDNFFNEHKDMFKNGKKTVLPSVKAINWAVENGFRFISIIDKKSKQKRYGENRAYYNIGINGSGQPSDDFAMRPGWHAGTHPTMRQIGKGKNKDLRDDSFVWVEGEIAADNDYNAEAQSNPDKDLPGKMPIDGYYLKATNADKKKSQADRMGWYVSGAFKANRIISDAEARSVIDEWNAAHPDKPIEYDYKRESGNEFSEEDARKANEANGVVVDDIEAEMAQIEAEAKANGTYMKAPNGKPSKLSPRQWAQVRTKAFKEWFGDWELGAKVLNIVSAAKDHGFNNFDDARKWAKENIVRTLSNEETGGKGEIRISNNAVNKFLSESAVEKSDSKDVHMSVLKVLPNVIRESIDAEQHPDYKKGEDGNRSVENGINENVTIHRLYGAANIDGKAYRVKITLKEFADKNETSSAYSYEATKIELLAGTLVDSKATDPSTNNSITVSKLLNGVEKSYGNGEKILDSSKVVDENGEPMVVYHGTKRKFWAFDGGKSKGKYIDGLNFFSLDRDFSERWINRDDERQRDPDDNAKLDEARQKSLQHKRETVKPLIDKYGSPRYAEVPEYNELAKEWDEWERNNLGLDGMTLEEAKYDYGKRLLECYINARNIYNPKDKYESEGRQMLIDLGIINATESGREKYMTDMYASNGSYLYYERKEVVDELKRRGYDGILLSEDVYSDESKNLRTLAVWDPTQIKSATENEGTFDSTNPDIRKREGNGVATDNDVVMAVDPVSKVLGSPRGTAQQRKARAERERRRMAETVGQMAEKLQLDNVDVITDTSTLSGRKAKAKGWFDPKTGRIVVVLPNHSSSMDVAQTVLHEAVAHYGLRRLFGDNFDSFLDTVWLSAEGDVKQRILNLAQRNGWNFRTATEEYLASLAEDTEFDNMNASWWNKIKSLFSEMLDKLGLGELLPMKLSDNELRYILWRSYMNLQGKDVGIMGNAADISKQMQLGVGNFTNTANNDKAADAEPLFRDGTPVAEGATAVRKALVRDKYEQRIKSGWYQTAEAIYDSMQSVKNAMEMVYEAEGEKKPYIEDIPMYENAYIGENVLSSMNKAQADYFANTLFKAMVEEYSKLARTKEERRDLDEYMMAKHGLERNKKMAERDAQRAYDEYKAANPSGTKTLNDFLTAYRQKEYAGLVGLFAKDEQIATALDRMEYLRERLKNVTDPSERAAIRKQIAELRLSNHIRAEKLAADAVELYESENDTADLWEAVRGVTGYTLEKQLSTGLMAADTYNKIKAMYEYYIPLRGFDADVSEDVYAYLGDNGANRNEAFVPVAEGRESKADNPLAYMQSMAESAIQSGNRNEMVKQRFLTFVQNHPSDLYSVSEMWLAYNEYTGEWEPVVNEEIDVNDSPAEVAAKQQAFDERMSLLAEAEPDKFRKASQAKDIPYRVLKKTQLKEHQVMVKRNGITYIITVNGNPRLAQAINGMTNPDADISGAVGKIVEFMQKGNRTLSQLYTSRNPNFVVSNFIRDSIYSSTMLLVKESPEYLANFIANVSKYNPWKMSSMFRKWNRGEVDDADMLLFKRFMLNGGETGYTELKAMEERKNDIAKQIKNATGKSRAKLIWEWIATSLDVVGRAVENTNRFGAFVTSLDMGRDVTRAAYDAKEISVNFNRKGSGSKMMDANGQTKLGNTAAFVSGVGRSLYIFWNAAIQGTGNLFKNYRRHPLKATAMTTFWLGLGYLMSAFMMGADGDGDDDDKEKYNGYFNLSQFIRRDNLCISVGGGQYATLPLPIEFRAVYGIGELFGSITSGKEQLTGDEIAYALFEQVSQIAPIDYSSGGMNAFIPSIVRPIREIEKNVSWTGLPIAKETPFNKYMPEYTKHYKNTNNILVGFTEQLNHAFGGDKVTRASTEWAEVNPAKVEYLMNAYLGGFFQVVDQTIKTAETVAGAREFDPRNITLLNRVLKSGDDRTAYRKINNDFYKAKKKYGILKGRLSGYKREALLGDEEYRQKWVNLMSEKEFEEMKVFDVFNKQLNKLYEVRKQMPEGSDEAKEIDTMSQALRIDALQAISDISNE